MRLLFKSTVSVDDFSAFAREQGWVLVEHWADDGSQPEEFVWDARGGVEVHRVRDGSIGLSYTEVTASSKSDARSREIERLIISRYPSYVKDEVIQLFDESVDWSDKVLVVPMLALVVSPGERDSRIRGSLVSALRDENRDVRLAGVVATFYAPWPEFIGELSKIEKGDTDSMLRAAAAESILNIEEQEQRGTGAARD